MGLREGLEIGHEKVINKQLITLDNIKTESNIGNLLFFFLSVSLNALKVIVCVWIFAR